MSVLDPVARPCVLNLDKPEGWTSRDVVDRVQDKMDGRKAGHGGTLDPIATGVLPVFLGQATRLVTYLHKKLKTYRVTMALNKVSETLDTEGITETSSPDFEPAVNQVESTFDDFTGRIKQIPPDHSAVKLQGEPAYKKARRGETVTLDSREVYVDSVQLKDYSFPTIDFTVTCGKGFYVRSLARDIGMDLVGQAGVVTGLRRIDYGPFSAQDACAPDQSDRWNRSTHPARYIVSDLPTVRLDGEALEYVSHGTWIPCQQDSINSGNPAVALGPNGRMVALLKARRENDRLMWHPKNVFTENLNR